MNLLQQAKQSLADIAELLESGNGEFVTPDQCTEFATEGEQLASDLRDLTKRANDPTASVGKPDAQQHQIYLQRCHDLRCRIKNTIRQSKAAKMIPGCDAVGYGSTVRPASEHSASQFTDKSDPEPSVPKLPELLVCLQQEGLDLSQALAEAQGASIVNKSTSKRPRKPPAGSGVRPASVRVQDRPTQPTRLSTRCHPHQASTNSTRTHRSPQASSAPRAVHHGFRPQDQDAFQNLMKAVQRYVENQPDCRVNKIDNIRTEKNIVDRVTISGSGPTINVGGSRNAGSVITKTSVPMQAPHEATETAGAG
ncbi:hypothetical protein V8B97DRAFT_1536995 [Scleroderma yunnanense]